MTSSLNNSPRTTSACITPHHITYRSLQPHLKRYSERHPNNTQFNKSIKPIKNLNLYLSSLLTGAETETMYDIILHVCVKSYGGN